jgi:carbonic anhydrase
MSVFINQLIEQNKKWVAKKLELDPDFFNKLKDIQAPNILWIGCSDSRIPANEVIGAQPGEVFVHRNIANMVIHSDMNLLSVLDYSVNILKIEHIIVCGHYGCGGVKAAMGNSSVGIIDNWIRHIKDNYTLNKDYIESVEDEKGRFDRFVECNIQQQVLNLGTTTIVQKAWSIGQKLTIHGWVYELGSGLINDLSISLSSTDNIISNNVYKLNFSA